jgi:hypothetical protein
MIVEQTVSVPIFTDIISIFFSCIIINFLSKYISWLVFPHFHSTCINYKVTEINLPNRSVIYIKTKKSRAFAGTRNG